MLTRLLKTVPLKSNVTQQLSFGVPHRISTERLIASHLHRNLCGANKTCARLGKTVVCVGSVPKSEWLDPRRRVDACARELIAEAPSSTSVNFCLMNSQTARLCLKMASWLHRELSFTCARPLVYAKSLIFLLANNI